MQCLSPKSTGFNEFSSNIATALSEGSGTPTEPYHTPSPEAQQTSCTTPSSPTLPSVTTDPIPTVTPSDTPTLRQYTRRARIAQADQDRANIAKTSTLPHDLAPRVTSPTAAEGTQELEINRLKARVKLLEDREGVAVERSRDDSPIKGRNLDEGRQQLREGSIPTAGAPPAEVPTGSDVVPTFGLIFATATVVTPYTRRKGTEKIVEFETPKKKMIQEHMDIQMARQLEEEMERDAQRMNEQIARDAEIARIHAKEELQSMIDGLDRSNETVAKYLQEYH
nr:hypothetical protein [Tanacetum cinerariifolium]